MNQEAQMATQTYRALVHTLDAKGKLVAPGATLTLDTEAAEALPSGTVEMVDAAGAKPDKNKSEDAKKLGEKLKTGDALKTGEPVKTGDPGQQTNPA
jgi:hypothetical protein